MHVPDRVNKWIKDEFNQGENSKNHPISQPSSGTLRRPMEDCLEGCKGRINSTNKGAGN